MSEFLLSHGVVGRRLQDRIPLNQRFDGIGLNSALQLFMHLINLDGWRGLAVTLLLLGHFFPVRGIDLGPIGVDLFFVLSGLLMGQLLFLKKTPLATFYFRRISRIFPAMLVFIATIVLGYGSTNSPVDWSQVVAAGTFTINYIRHDIGVSAMPLEHVWSLSVEEHSYVLLSLLALASRKRSLDPGVSVGICTLIFATTIIVYWLREGQSGPWRHSEVSAFGIFCSATFMLLLRGRKPHVPAMTIPILLLVAFAAHWWRVPQPIRYIVGVGAFALVVNLLPLAPAYIHSLLSLRPLRQLGTWSYSIYLWQQVFYFEVNAGMIAPLFGVVLAIGSGIASFYLVENPARKYLNRRWIEPGRAGNSIPAPGHA